MELCSPLSLIAGCWMLSCFGCSKRSSISYGSTAGIFFTLMIINSNENLYSQPTLLSHEFLWKCNPAQSMNIDLIGASLSSIPCLLFFWISFNRFYGQKIRGKQAPMLDTWCFLLVKQLLWVRKLSILGNLCVCALKV